MRLNLPFHSYRHRARQVANMRLVNCYPEQMPIDGKGPLCLLRAPGTELWVTLPTAPIRGMAVHDDTLFVVSGNVLYSVSSSGYTASLGTIGNGAVSMVSNGPQLVIIAKPNGYVLEGVTLTQISDIDFTERGATTVGVLDGFTVCVEPTSGRFFVSDYLDATSWDPLGFATAEGYPDNLVAALVDHRQLLLFGSETTEVWYNAGSAGPIPFLREQNGLIESGCGAMASPAKVDNSVVWLDEKRILRKLSDLTPQRISTHGAEMAWAGYARVDDAIGMSYVHEGHWFYNLVFPSADACWTWDAATGEFAERESVLTDGTIGAWRAAGIACVYGENIVGDRQTGQLGKIRSDCYTEWGNPLRMTWTYPPVYGQGRKAFHQRLEINCDVGVGTPSGTALGVDPQILLSVSDNGKHFVPLPNRYLGKVGEYRKRATWHRLGASYDRIYQASVSEPVPVAVWDTSLEVEGGRF